MGQEVSQETCQYQNQNWKLVQENPQHPLYRINPYCQRCFFNQLTNEYVEEYALQFASEKDYMTYVQEIKFRKDGLQCSVKDQKNCLQMQTFISSYIYPVKEFVNQTSSSLCSTIYKGLLYIESVDLRLKDINDIPTSDQLYLLGSTLEGFQYLYQKVGFFDICEEMIFITSLGKVRVWLNPNLSKMEPFINHKTSKEYQNRQVNGSQSDMVSNLINIIESNTLHNNDKIVPFKQYLIDKGIFTKLSFYKALQELQFYCRQNRLCVGDHLNSVYEMHQSIHIDGCQQEQSIAFSQKSKELSKQLADLVNNAQAIIHKRSRSQYSNSIVSVGSKKSVKFSRFAKEKSRKLKNQSIVLNNQANLQQDQFVIKESLSTHKRQEQICMDSSNHKQKWEKPIKVYTFSEDYQANLASPSQNIECLRITKQTNETQMNPNIRQQATTIKFSYFQIPSNITSKKLNSYGNLNSMNTLHSHSQSSYSLKQDILSTQARQSTNKISYHSPQESFTLDSELAQDLKNMLGYKMDDSR